MVDLIADVKRVMRDVPDFPRDGVLFKDMTPVLQDPSLFRRVVAWMGEGVGTVDKVVGIESRGFIFAAPMVDTLDAGLVLARKKGKLPWRTVSRDYELEYGSATLEIHADAIAPGERVLVVDDLLATGGTARASSLKCVPMSSRELSDLLMLGMGAYTPLDGFMGHDDWRGACEDMRLASGVFWPIPITLSCSQDLADSIAIGEEVALVDAESGETMALMTVNEKYTIDRHL
ncbi:MAG: adenine phosphoribosyltransferase, partial [Myxococcales bacterium]|nr:adenine phosphoribosyltransferase [Myxococcales bacterium]